MTPANVRRVLLLLFIALVGLGVYVANHSENSTTSRKVTRIEAASPCLTYGPKSELCKESFEKAVLTITHPEACAILRKAGLEVVECAHARLRQEHTRHSERTHSKEVQSLENGSAGSSAPVRGGSGAGPVPGLTGGSGGVSPHPGGHAPPQSPHQPSSTQPSEPIPAPVATVLSPSQPEQMAGEETTPAPEPSSAPGLIGNPGGVVGGLCPTLNRLLPVCE